MAEGSKTDRELLFALFEHHNCEARSRREPEFTYTAASVAGLGAIAWGVAALATTATTLNSKGMWWATLATTCGIFILVVIVSLKILYDHAAYVNVRKAQQEVVRRLMPDTDHAMLLPQGFMSENPGSGHRGSVAIVVAAAVPAIGFCVAFLVR